MQIDDLSIQDLVEFGAENGLIQFAGQPVWNPAADITYRQPDRDLRMGRSKEDLASNAHPPPGATAGRTGRGPVAHQRRERHA